jgi:hypothetical protein
LGISKRPEILRCANISRLLSRVERIPFTHANARCAGSSTIFIREQQAKKFGSSAAHFAGSLSFRMSAAQKASTLIVVQLEPSSKSTLTHLGVSPKAFSLISTTLFGTVKVLGSSVDARNRAGSTLPFVPGSNVTAARWRHSKGHSSQIERRALPERRYRARELNRGDARAAAECVRRDRFHARGHAERIRGRAARHKQQLLPLLIVQRAPPDTKREFPAAVTATGFCVWRKVSGCSLASFVSILLAFRF